MNYRRFVTVAAAVILALTMAGCEGYENYTPTVLDLTRIAQEWPDDDPAKPTIMSIALERYAAASALEAVANEAAVTQAAARAAAEREYVVLTAQAHERALAHQRALEVAHQAATAQAAEANRQAMAIAQAQAVEATRQAWEVEATAIERTYRAASTAQAVAEATREAEAAALAASQAVALRSTQVAQHAQTTAVHATAQSIERRSQREAAVEPLRRYAPWLVAAVLLGFFLWLGWRFAQVAEDRARVVKRGADEGEPLVVWRERVALPLRMFSPYADMTRGEENAPQLAPPLLQEGATSRQQAANFEQAQHAHETGTGTVRVFLPPDERPRSKNRQAQEPGLLGPIADSAIAPQLLEAITTQWQEIEEGEV